MKDLSYNNFFGKEVKHDQALKDRVSSAISHILAYQTETSEKDFKRYDKIIKKADKLVEENFDKISDFYNRGKRYEYIAELIFDENKNIDLTNENKIINFDDFKRL